MNIKRASTFLAALAVTFFIGAGFVSADKPDKVTICHAAGLAGTTQYVTLTIAYPAVYGPAGHFYENGTPQAGHEQDYIGACRVDTTTTTTAPTTTTLPETTTTVFEKTTTTTAAATTTIAPTTTLPITTTPASTVPATTTPAPTSTVVSIPVPTTTAIVPTVIETTTLPVTGSSSTLLILAGALCAGGAIMLAVRRKATI